MIPITIKAKDAEEVGIIAMLLSENGVEFKIGNSAPTKPKSKGLQGRARAKNLTPAQVVDIMNWLSRHPEWTNRRTAKRFKVSQGTVNRIRNGLHPHQKSGAAK